MAHIFTCKFIRADKGTHVFVVNEPSHEKTKNLGLRPGLIQTGLHSDRRMQEG